MSARYVVAGLARGRCRWFGDVARWSTAGLSPIEFVKCLTADEVRAVIGAGRRLSAVLVDAATPGLDRDLVDVASSVDCPVIVVSDGRTHRDWESIGCAAVIADDFGPDELAEILGSCAHRVDREVTRAASVRIRPDDAAKGQTIAVIGTGGVGTSTVAMLAAQALAADRSVVLVDGARRAHHAMFHDVGDVMPGLPELVEAHRGDRLAPGQVKDLTFEIPTRGYSVLLGLRRPHEWTAMRRRSVDAALDALQRSFEVAVVDLDSDLDGEAQTGSTDVGDRHAMTAATLAIADLVLVVGHHDLKGLASIDRLHGELIDSGVDPLRCTVVFNRAERSPARRALAARSLASLLDPASASCTPLFVRHLRNIDDLHHRCAPLPNGAVERIGRAVTHSLTSLPDRTPSEDDAVEPQPIAAGSLGVARSAPKDAA